MKTLLLTVACTCAAFLIACSAAAPTEPVQPLALQTETAPPPVDETWRVNRPAPGPEPSLVIPKFAEVKLGNGLTVIVSERRTLPLVSIGFAVKAGSAVEPSAKAGLADLTYEMMLEGAGGRDGVALAETFADLGTSASASTEQDGGVFTVTALKKNLKPCLSLISDIALRPTFKAEDFSRKQKEQLADLARLWSEPQFLSMIGIEMEIFGATHPYGHPTYGTAASVKKIALQDIKKFYKDNIVPRKAALVIAGDIDVEEAKALAEEFFGAWKADGAKEKPVKKVPITPRKRVAVIEKKGLNQTIIAMGSPAVKAGDKDEWSLNIATDVFGGLFGSRLNMNLRENKGYTYGARAQLNAMRDDGGLFAASPVQGDVTGLALKEFVKEAEGITANQITEEEFKNARDSVLRSISGQFESVNSLARAASGIFFKDLPLDRYEQMVAGYRAVTLDEVRDATKRYFIAQNLKVVLVGDPDILNAQVPPLNLGKIEAMPLAQ